MLAFAIMRDKRFRQDEAWHLARISTVSGLYQMVQQLPAQPQADELVLAQTLLESCKRFAASIAEDSAFSVDSTDAFQRTRQGIHTIMLSCIIVAQSSLGSTAHRGLLRVIGAVLGSLAALLMVILVMPHIESVVGLLAMSLPIIGLGAWIYAGSEKISYAGITLPDAVNFLVEKYELVRIDRKGFSWQEQSPYLRAVDILRARQATGLLQRSRNNAVS